MSPTRRPSRLLLIGMMGSGKTTVGRIVAQRLGWPYVDNDALVAEVAGAATAEVGTHGAAALHLVEGIVVDRILAMPVPLVAGIPGSAVANEQARAELRDAGTVVWLRARLDTLEARIGDGLSRPFFAGQDPEAVLRKLYAGRAPAYQASADHVVDVDELSPDQVADAVLALLDADDGAGDETPSD